MRNAPIAGFGMPVTQSGPRVNSTQLVATTCMTTAKPSVPIAKLCSVSRNIGTPMTSAAAPATTMAARQRAGERPARLGDEQRRRVRADAEERRMRERQVAHVTDDQVVAQRERAVERGEDEHVQDVALGSGRDGGDDPRRGDQHQAQREPRARAPHRQMPIRRPNSPCGRTSSTSHHDDERDRVLERVRDVARGERLGEADEEARRDRAADVAEAARDDRREGLERQQRADVREDVEERRHEDGGRAGERRGEGERREGHALHVDAHHRAGLAVLGHRPHGLAHLRPRHEPLERRRR